MKNLGSRWCIKIIDQRGKGIVVKIIDQGGKGIVVVLESIYTSLRPNIYSAN